MVMDRTLPSVVIWFLLQPVVAGWGAGKADSQTVADGDAGVPFHFINQHINPGQEMVAGWGFGGPVRARPARAGSLRLGHVIVNDPLVFLSTSKLALDDTASSGLIGNGILRRFNFLLDYPRRELILEKSKTFAEPDRIKHSDS